MLPDVIRSLIKCLLATNAIVAVILWLGGVIDAFGAVWLGLYTTAVLLLWALRGI